MALKESNINYQHLQPYDTVQNVPQNSANTFIEVDKVDQIKQLADTCILLLSDIIKAEAYAFYIYCPGTLYPLFVCSIGVPKPLFVSYRNYQGKNSADPILTYIKKHHEACHNEHPEVKQYWLDDPRCRIFKEKGYRFVLKAPIFIDASLIGSLNMARNDYPFNFQEMKKSNLLANVLSVSLRPVIGSIEYFQGGKDPGNSKYQLSTPLNKPWVSILTKRENEVLNILISGMTNKQIADCLTISQNTVKKHLKNIYEKLGVQSRRELFSLLFLCGDSSRQLSG